MAGLIGEKALHIGVGLAGVHALLYKLLQRLGALLLGGQPEHRPGMALGKAVGHAVFLLLRRERQQPQLLFRVGCAMPRRRAASSWVQPHRAMTSLMPQACSKGSSPCRCTFFQKAQGRGLVVFIIAQDGRDLGEARQLAGAQAPLARNQLVTAVLRLAHRDRLQKGRSGRC